MSEDISNSKIKHRQDVRASRSTKTIHCLILAFRATKAVLDPDRAQPSWRLWPQIRRLKNTSLAVAPFVSHSKDVSVCRYFCF